MQMWFRRTLFSKFSWHLSNIVTQILSFPFQDLTVFFVLSCKHNSTCLQATWSPGLLLQLYFGVAGQEYTSIRSESTQSNEIQTPVWVKRFNFCGATVVARSKKWPKKGVDNHIRSYLLTKERKKADLWPQGSRLVTLLSATSSILSQQMAHPSYQQNIITVKRTEGPTCCKRTPNTDPHEFNGSGYRKVKMAPTREGQWLKARTFSL